MSLQLIAKQMEAKGRNGDSVLVHMTTGEVAGLQKLAESAGESLSINPETGLVEANILKQFLPTIIGGALMASGVGMPLAIAGGALAGGLQARQDDGDFLTGALMGGLGAYGGAGLAGSLGAAGAAAGTGMGAGAAGTNNAIAANLTPTTIPSPATSFTRDMMVGTPPSAVAPQMSASALPQADLATQYGLNSGTAAPATMSESFANTSRGLENLQTQQGRDAAYDYLGGGKGVMKTGLAALAPALSAPAEQQESPYPLMSMDLNMNKGAGQGVAAYEPSALSYNYQGNNVYIPTFRAAEGGSTGGDSGGSDMVLTDDAARSMLGKFPTMKKLVGQLSPATLARLGVGQKKEAPAVAPRQAAPELRAYEPKMPQYSYQDGAYIPTFRAAEGGLAQLAKGGMKEGAFIFPADIVSIVGEGNTEAGYEIIKDIFPGAVAIRGKDGGQSDTVKTSIEGKQPAAVAHGEMYLTPEDVKDAGGAKKLYAVMDKIRKQATGTKKQMKPVSLESAMA